MTIYVLNPLNEPVASGGVQKLHDHVEILNDAGLDAAIVNAPGFEPWWFPTRARILKPPIVVRRGDLLAVPEVYGDCLLTVAPGFPRVSINQNAFLRSTFRRPLFELTGSACHRTIQNARRQAA